MNRRSNRQEREGPSRSEVRPWADLPVELLGLIYGRLFPIDCIAFALACHPWQRYARSRRWPSFPLILPQFFWANKCRIRSPFHSNVYLPYRPPRNGDIRCRGAVGSWLLYYTCTDGQPFFFVDHAVNYNKPVDLPLWHWTWRPVQDAIISAAPTDPDGCTVVFLSGKTIVYCKVGDSEWSSCEVDTCLDSSVGAFLGGTLHVIDEHQRLGVVDFENVQNAVTWLGLDVHQLKQRLTLPMEYGRHFLMESSGTLLLAFLGQGWCWYVFRADLTALTWRGVEDLEDRSLFLARGGSMSAVAVEAGVEANRLYFARAETPQAPLANWISVAAHRRDNCWEENSLLRYIADISLPIVASRWVFQRAGVIENEPLARRTC